VAEFFELNGITYKMKNESEKITLQRYNEQHKMNIILHLPKGKQKKRIEEEIIQILSNQYISRHTQEGTPEGG